MHKAVKEIVWVGNSLKELRSFPDVVKQVFGAALYYAQLGGKHPQAVPLKGFRGAGVLEVVEDHDNDTYRCVYTVRYAQKIYVLHTFQKKSKKGIATPQPDIETINSRLKDVQKREGIRS